MAATSTTTPTAMRKRVTGRTLLHGVPLSLRYDSRATTADEQKRITLLINIWPTAPQKRKIRHQSFKPGVNALTNMARVSLEEIIVNQPTISDNVKPSAVLSQINKMDLKNASSRTTGVMLVS